MATLYLKNTSGSLVNVIDLGISLPNSQSLVIDSNSINAYLTSDLQAVITSGSLILSSTDIGDNGGDMSITDAIAALSITTRFDRDNPHNTTITQALSADSTTTVTVAQLNDLTDGGETTLHIHDGRYYTETELSTSNPATVNVHWDNIINAPQFGSLEWQRPALGNLVGMGTAGSEPTNPKTGSYYLNTGDEHLYKYGGSLWIDQGAPALEERVVFKDGVGSNDRIYEWNGTDWTTDPVPQDNWAIIVSDDGDGKAAQYVYDTSGAPPDWIKIADVDWGSHNALANRDDTGSHPASAISYNNTISGLSATNVQDALNEIATEQGVDLNNIVFVAKNGVDVNANVTLGTIANPYLTIGAAITSITGASSTNRYVVYVMPGDYNENVVLNKSFVYIASPNKEATRITSLTGNTLTLSSTSEKSTGVYNISVVSNSSLTTDNAIYISGNNPSLFNIDVYSPSGARTLLVNGAYSQTLRHINLKGGEFRVDSGVVEFYDSKVIEALTNVTGGTLRVHNGDFSHNGGDAISQTGGTVYLVSAKLISGASAKDFNQSGGTVYWGWVEYDDTKITIGGTKYLLFESNDLYYNSTGNTVILGNDIDTVISNIDIAIQNILTANSTHAGRVDNPHVVTFTQAVTADPGTDITVAEAETLTNGSNADLLHKHDATNITYTNYGKVNVAGALDETEKAIRQRFSGHIYVDQNRTDTYTADGSIAFPYKNIGMATADVGAVNGTVIIVSEGNFVEDITLPIGVSLQGAGTSKTYIEGTITTTGSAFVNISNMSVYDNILLTSKALLEDMFIRGQLNIAAVTAATGIEGRNITVSPTTGSALIIGNNVELLRFIGGAIYSNDGSTALSASSGVTMFDDYIIAIRNTPSSNPTISLTGTCNIHLNQSVVQSTGGNTLISNATNTYHNMISDVQYAGGVMNFNNSPTIIEGVHDVMNGVKIPTGNAIIKRPGEQIAYNDSATSLGATNVQGAIEVLSSLITSFEMPAGTTFPTVPAPTAGDIFYRTDLNMTYQYDSSRGKWLSMSQMFLDWGSNIADGKYLNIHGATATQTGYLMPYSGTIVSITAKIASGNQSKALELRRNNDRVTPLESFSLTSGSYSSTVKNIDFNAGDYIQAFIPSSGVPAKDIVVMAVVCWR